MKKPFKLVSLFKRTIDNLKIMRLLWTDYRNGNYQKMPVKGLISFGLFIAYILNPFDLLSDFIPFWGQLDDFGILMFCLYLLDQETSQYQLWRENKT